MYTEHHARPAWDARAQPPVEAATKPLAQPTSTASDFWPDILGGGAAVHSHVAVGGASVHTPNVGSEGTTVAANTEAIPAAPGTPPLSVKASSPRKGGSSGLSSPGHDSQ